MFSAGLTLLYQTTQSILEYIRNPKSEGKPSPVDILRLVIVFYLSAPDNAISKEDIVELEKELRAAGADVIAFEYVRRVRDISRMSIPSALGGSSTPAVGGQQAGELFRGFSALGNRVCLLCVHSTWDYVLNIRFPADGPLERGWVGEPHIGSKELFTGE